MVAKRSNLETFDSVTGFVSIAFQVEKRSSCSVSMVKPISAPICIDEMFLDMRSLLDLVGRSVAIRDEVRRSAKILTWVGIVPPRRVRSWRMA